MAVADRFGEPYLGEMGGPDLPRPFCHERRSLFTELHTQVTMRSSSSWCSSRVTPRRRPNLPAFPSGAGCPVGQVPPVWPDELATLHT